MKTCGNKEENTMKNGIIISEKKRGKNQGGIDRRRKKRRTE